jgi:hypothetical protein
MDVPFFPILKKSRAWRALLFLFVENTYSVIVFLVKLTISYIMGMARLYNNLGLPNDNYLNPDNFRTKCRRNTYDRDRMDYYG